MLMNINNNVKVILLLFYSKKKSKNANRYGNRYSINIPILAEQFHGENPSELDIC